MGIFVSGVTRRLKSLSGVISKSKMATSRVWQTAQNAQIHSNMGTFGSRVKAISRKTMSNAILKFKLKTSDFYKAENTPKYHPTWEFLSLGRQPESRKKKYGAIENRHNGLENANGYWFSASGYHPDTKISKQEIWKPT